MSREASIERTTSETSIRTRLNIDGKGVSNVHSGIAFFDHMLTLFRAACALRSRPRCQGDIDVDFHHTVEDVGITLGQALTKALGDKAGIKRYGAFYVPMDESLVRAVIDLSGRPYLVYNPPSAVEAIGGFFSFSAGRGVPSRLAINGGMNLHVEILAGRDSHHMAEGVFKAVARASTSPRKLILASRGCPAQRACSD